MKGEGDEAKRPRLGACDKSCARDLSELLGKQTYDAGARRRAEIEHKYARLLDSLLDAGQFTQAAALRDQMDNEIDAALNEVRAPHQEITKSMQASARMDFDAVRRLQEEARAYPLRPRARSGARNRRARASQKAQMRLHAAARRLKPGSRRRSRRRWSQRTLHSLRASRKQ